MSVEQVIILAAGQGYQLDGINKVLIRHPKTGKTILEHALDAFCGKRVTVVVGFRAIQIMEMYPELNYVINPDWALTNNAMSLGLALTTEPVYVVSGDIFISKPLVDELDEGHGNLIVTEHRENRALTSIHCVVDESDIVRETYQGPIKDIRHPEAIGLFKISDSAILREWRKRSINHGNLFVGQTLPVDLSQIGTHPIGRHEFDEINTPSDYLRLLKKFKQK
jgi:choline kinase